MKQQADLKTIGAPCGAWCFVFGLMGMGPNGTPIRCMEDRGHDTEKVPHKTVIVSEEPVARFEVTWTVG